MKKNILVLFLMLASLSGFAQVTTVPTIPEANQAVTLTFNKTGTGLAAYSGIIYAHIGVTVNGNTWQNVIGSWGNNTLQPALSGSGNSQTLTISPSLFSYFGVSTSASITQICVVFRSANGAQQSTDFFINVGAFQANLNSPLLIGHSIAGILLPYMAPAFDHVCYLAASMPTIGQSITEMMGTSLRGTDPTVIGWPVEGSMAERFHAMFGPDIDPAVFAWMMSEIAQDVHPACLNSEAITRQSAPGIATSYIAAQRDPILPPVWQGRFAERVSARDVYEIDSPHEPFLSHPDLLAELVVGRLV